MPVKVSGARELRRTLKQAGVSAADLKAAHGAAARTVLGAAHPPRRSGALAASQRATQRANAATILAGSARLPYAPVIHWGWPRRHIRAQPWLSQAAERTQPRWLAQYDAAIDAILAKISTE